MIIVSNLPPLLRQTKKPQPLNGHCIIIFYYSQIIETICAFQLFEIVINRGDFVGLELMDDYIFNKTIEYKMRHAFISFTHLFSLY